MKSNCGERMKKVIYLTILLISVWSCSTVVYNTYSQQDPETDLTDYDTFAWVPRDSANIQNFLYDNEFIAKRIREATNSEFETRGYRQASRNPDLLVRYRVIVEEEDRIVSSPIYAPAPVNPYYQVFPYNRNYPYDNSFNYNYSFYGNLYNHQYNFNPYFTPPYQFQFQPQWGGSMFATTPVVTGSNFHQIEFNVGTVVIDVLDGNTHELLWRGWSESGVDNPEFFETEVDNIINYIFDRYPVKEQQAATY